MKCPCCPGCPGNALTCGFTPEQAGHPRDAPVPAVPATLRISSPIEGDALVTTTPINSRTRLTVAQVCDDLGISRSTFYEWRAKGTGPRCIKLPNGEIRVRRVELERWLDSREEAA
jgi:predicted DNA-binding transcriptional regulator AlpA